MIPQQHGLRAVVSFIVPPPKWGWNYSKHLGFCSSAGVRASGGAAQRVGVKGSQGWDVAPAMEQELGISAPFGG